jgi:hypothetical protein
MIMFLSMFLRRNHHFNCYKFKTFSLKTRNDFWNLEEKYMSENLHIEKQFLPQSEHWEKQMLPPRQVRQQNSV